ncbi:amino acid kinase family protein [Stetteria hydrogenophila]
MPRLACRSAVVKLGGSLVTDKRRPRVVDWAALSSAARQLAEYHRLGGRLALVHGGGSFGHASVAELGGSGALTPGNAGVVQLDMLRLAVAVADVLISHGIPVTVHPPHSLCSCDRCDLAVARRDYSKGLAPMTYGDVVLCGGGASIISGDRLARLLAVELGVDCVVYATRDPGVRGPDGRVLEVLDVSGGIPGWLDGSGGFDQTGGMAAKVAEAARIPREVTVRIVGVDGVWEALIEGRGGTLVAR